MSISPDGVAYWCSSENRSTSTITSENGKIIELAAPSGQAFSFPLVQRFEDGRWLIVEARNFTAGPNAFVFDKSGRLISSFYAGDGIQTVMVDSKDSIWIGFFDEGIFGAFDAPPDHPWHRFGPNGLVRLNRAGSIEFAYNRDHQDKGISDIYAITVDEKDRLWFSPYTDFFLASVADNRVQYLLPKSPRPMESALCVGPNFFSFFGGFRESSMVTVVERGSQSLRLLQLLAEDGNTLSPVQIATRGTKAVALASNVLYRLDEEALLSALGPWQDGNTSTVESAVQYHDEESSYSGYYVIDGKGSHRVAGQLRPASNPPRDDYDSGQGPL